MSIYINRIEMLRKSFIEFELDAAIITSDSNVFYLSGFTGGKDATLVITANDSVALTDFRYEEQIVLECPCYKAIIMENNKTDELADLIRELGVSKIAVEEKALSYIDYIDIQDSLSWCDILHLSDTLENMRMIKSADEIDSIRKASNISDKAFNHVLKLIKPGVSECDIASEIEYFMRKMGAKRPSFETIVASGLRGAMPHGTASSRIMQQGESVTLDFGALFMGYCSDMTRTVFIGEPTNELLKVYKVVAEAQLLAINGFYTGINASDLDKIARDYIEDKGYGRFFGHGLGHGIGIDIHEKPRISKKGTSSILDGMVFSVEPGIYLDGIGGVRIEDMVTPINGILSIITNATKELVIL